MTKDDILTEILRIIQNIRIGASLAETEEDLIWLYKHIDDNLETKKT